jgi:ribose transport system substrate-binding protein
MRLIRRSLAVMFFVGCSSLHAADAPPKIGVLLKSRGGFWASVEKGARTAGIASGAEVIVKAPLSESDIGVQVQMLNALAGQGVDAIVIAPNGKEALSVPIASIAVKGVKIVVIDTKLQGKAGSIFIGTDHQAAGAVAGRLLAGLVNDSDEVTILRHSQTSGATTARESGALAAFREAHPKNVVHAEIYASAEQGGEMDKARLVLSSHPNTKAILATGTSGTMAMLKVLQEKKLAGSIKLIGFGFNLNPEAAAAIESGALTGWIAQLPNEIGEKGVTAALKLLKGETLPPTIFTDVIVVTKDNLHSSNVQALLKL